MAAAANEPALPAEQMDPNIHAAETIGTLSRSLARSQLTSCQVAIMSASLSRCMVATLSAAPKQSTVTQVKHKSVLKTRSSAS